MRYDPFEFDAESMSGWDRLWRIVFLVACAGTALLDILYWRP